MLTKDVLCASDPEWFSDTNRFRSNTRRSCSVDDISKQTGWGCWYSWSRRMRYVHLRYSILGDPLYCMTRERPSCSLHKCFDHQLGGVYTGKASRAVLWQPCGRDVLNESRDNVINVRESIGPPTKFIPPRDALFSITSKYVAYCNLETFDLPHVLFPAVPLTVLPFRLNIRQLLPERLFIRSGLICHRLTTSRGRLFWRVGCRLLDFFPPLASAGTCSVFTFCQHARWTVTPNSFRTRSFSN